MIIFIGVALAIVILAVVMWMLLTRRIREKYGVFWIIIALAVLVVGVFPGLLAGLTRLVGVQLPSNLIFTAAIVLLLVVALHLSWELSQVEEETRRLAEEAAITRGQLEVLEERIAQLESSAEHDGSRE